MVGVEILLRDRVAKSHASRMDNLCAYIEKEDNREQVLAVWHENALSAYTGDNEMRALASCNPRARKPMRHFVLSWPAGEAPTPEQAREAGRMTLAETGLSGCVAKLALHADTDNLHLHIAVCTVDPISQRMVKAEFVREALHRAMARIEHQQGWKPEANALYLMTSEGVLQRRTERNAGRDCKPAGRAVRAQVFSGEKPAGEVAAEAVQCILQDQTITSWPAFHRLLANAGLVYERKGSGAVIGVQQEGARRYVKVSSVSRAASLTILVQRFGDYVSGDNELMLSRAIEAARTLTGKRRQLWQQYRQERIVYFGNKADHYRLQKARHDDARKALIAQQWQERQALFSRDRARDCRIAINGLRSALAAAHASQKAALRERLAQERQDDRKRYRDGFPIDYTSWLNKHRACETDQAASQEPSAAFLAGPAQVATPRDIRSYQAQIVGRIVRYVNRRTGSVDFIDSGRRIDSFKENSPEAIRAALQLAAEKWHRGFRLHGSEAFKQAALSEALSLGVADMIANPDLKEAVARQKNSAPASQRQTTRRRGAGANDRDRQLSR